MKNDKANQMLPALEKPEGYVYMEGYPLSYRFNAKEGKLFFEVGGEVFPLIDLTKEAVTITPLAFRAFKSIDLFGVNDTDGAGEPRPVNWVEIFFANRRGHVCSLLFHKYSAENFSRLFQSLYYEEKSLCDVTLSIRAEKVTSKSGNTFAKAVFAIAGEIAEDWETPSPLYRVDSIKPGQEILRSENWEVPGMVKEIETTHTE